ncbi:WD repeat-containing and planar cell polarity effector protein fritz homolog [Watersipora subatra]|uniref:WD repeat-containing and planar cell polarity effector protein fritz homolog n=1 Tax=Watersipora subatra TaxID=2589382 RepID=UPI00355B7722
MAVLKSEVHLWTLRNQLLISETGLGCLTYHDKTEKASSSVSSGSSIPSYAQEKQVYVESHGKTWTPSNKRPDKLRDHVKDLEESLSGTTNVFTWWKSEDLLQIFLSTGIVYWISIDQLHGDICKITKDTSLIGRITLSNICDVAFTCSFMALCSADTSKLEIIHYSKGALVDAHRKLSSLEPKIYSVNLPGRPGRSLQRQLQVSPSQDHLLVYWPIVSEEAWPWAPMSNEEERANLCIISLVSGKPSIAAFTKTESDPLKVQFCSADGSKLRSVEKSVNAKTPRADLCSYELTISNIHRTQHTTVPLASLLTGASWDCYNDTLVLSCEDNSIILYNENIKNTVTAKTEFHADFMEWHPSGALLLILNHKGDIQIFDKALNCLSLTLEGVEFVPHIKLSNFFRAAPHVKRVSWCHHSNNQPGQGLATRNTLLLTFDRGPIGVMKFVGGNLASSDISCSLIIAEYLRANNFLQAVNLVKVMSWDTEGLACFQGLVNIINCLLRQPLNKSNEEMLEATLGCFYAPQKALAEVVILEYRVHIGYLARRFFHHLIRYSRFDKAFLLAVDINSRDLFMDIYYAALDLGQHRLAAAAKQKARHCEDELLFSDSGSSFNEADLLSDDELYSGASSEGSLVESRERAEAIVLARVNGHAPPLPPRKLPNKVTPPVPPRGHRHSITSLHKTPSSGDSTPPLPPRVRASDHGQAETELSGERNQTNTSKYHHVTGCTLPSGYSYELGPEVSQRIIEDFNSMIVDGESLGYTQVPELQANIQSMEKKSVKVIHFGLV